jgi:hypothetical protein
MRALALVFAVLDVATWGGAWWLARILGGLNLWELFLSSRLITQLMDILLALFAVVILIAGFIRDARGAPVFAPVMKPAMWVASAMGLLVALESGLETWTVAQRVHVNFEVVAPTLCEGLVPLAIGLLCAALCAWFASVRRRGSTAAG